MLQQAFCNDERVWAASVLASGYDSIEPMASETRMRVQRPTCKVADVCGLALMSSVASCNGWLGIEPAALEAVSFDAGGPAGGTSIPVSHATVDAGAAAPTAVEAATTGGAGSSSEPAPGGVPPTTDGATMGGAPPPAAAPAVTPTSDAGPPAAPEPAPAPASLPPGPPLGADGLALPLPDDLSGAPVTGEIVFSEEASWEVDGVFQPTFEIHTPTGSYWVVKTLGTMVSMQDAYAGQLQWIDFSSGFRPLRNVPAFATPPAGVTTVLDADSQTPTHLRLTSVSADQAWQWVWDFYITHATLTINRAPVAVGFSYRGVPAGTLGIEDELVQSDGTTQGARNSFSGDVPGPIEWVYIADTAAGRSLFLMQHSDDSLPDRYQVRDNDSAMWIFGDGAITSLPMRFSLGLVDSVEHARVAERVQFVAAAIH